MLANISGGSRLDLVHETFCPQTDKHRILKSGSSPGSGPLTRDLRSPFMCVSDSVHHETDRRLHRHFLSSVPGFCVCFLLFSLSSNFVSHNFSVQQLQPQRHPSGMKKHFFDFLSEMIVRPYVKWSLLSLLLISLPQASCLIWDNYRLQTFLPIRCFNFNFYLG